MFKHIKFANMLTHRSLNFYYSNQLFFTTPRPTVKIYALNIVDVSYTGKTYKWFYRSKFWKLIFNRVHPTLLFFKNKIVSKKLGKTKLRLFLYSVELKNNMLSIFDYTRRYNVFTQRGIKVKGRLFYKKRGKISTYR